VSGWVNVNTRGVCIRECDKGMDAVEDERISEGVGVTDRSEKVGDEGRE
jgi:hypothetical protein